MATPELQVQTATLNLRESSPFSVRINTFNADGSVRDVSSGYTVKSAIAQPQSNPNPSNGGYDLASHMSAAFDATGVTLSGTAAQAATIINGLLSTLNTANLRLSDDAGTTNALVAKLVIAIDASSVAS